MVEHVPHMHGRKWAHTVAGLQVQIHPVFLKEVEVVCDGASHPQEEVDVGGCAELILLFRELEL